MSQQEFRGLALTSRSVPSKQFFVNNLAYQSQVVQIPICLIMDSNLLYREKKKVSLPKDPLFQTPSFMIFHLPALPFQRSLGLGWSFLL